MIAFAARASLAARKDVADALHLVGAEDSYIAALFERRFFMLGVKAGAAGAFFAAAILVLVVFGGGSGTENFLPGRLAVADDLRSRW